jgi:hypothetical protein
MLVCCACISPTSPCRYGAVLFLRGSASLLLWLRFSGAWVLGSQGISRVIELRHEVQSTCWIVLDCPRYLYVSVHCTLWFIDRFTFTRAAPELTHLQLHRETPRSDVDVRLAQDAAWDRSAALALGKNPLCENSHFLSHICKSFLRALIRRDVVSDIYVTPDRILVFIAIGWWFSPCFVSQVPRPDVPRGLWKWPVWLFSVRNSL